MSPNLDIYKKFLCNAKNTAMKFVKSDKVIAIATTVGIGLTGYLAYKHGTRVDVIKTTAEDEDECKKELIKSAAPAVVSGVITTGMVWLSHQRTKYFVESMLMATTAIATQASKERQQVIDIYGEPIEITVAKKKFDKDRIIDVSNIDGGEEEFGETLLFYDPHFECYYQTTMNRVMAAMMKLKDTLLNEPVSCGYFAELLGLPKETCTSQEGVEYGWNMDLLRDCYWENTIQFKLERIILDDDLNNDMNAPLECIYVHYVTAPMDNYWLDSDGEPY